MATPKKRTVAQWASIFGKMRAQLRLSAEGMVSEKSALDTASEVMVSFTRAHATGDIILSETEDVSAQSNEDTED